MNDTIRSAQPAGHAPARLTVAVPQLLPPLGHSTRSTYQQPLPDKTRPPRSVVPIGLASVIISGCVYAGTELVLALLDRPALLAAPRDVVRYVSQVNEIAPAVLLALGVVVAAAGVALVLVTGRAARRPAATPVPVETVVDAQAPAAPPRRASVAGTVTAASVEPEPGAWQPVPPLPRKVGAAPDRFTAAKAIADALAYDARRVTIAPTVVGTTTLLQTTP